MTDEGAVRASDGSLINSGPGPRCQMDLVGVGHAWSDGHPLFTGLTATLLPDHVYGVVGPSGSGKSTLLGILAGWVDPLEGRLANRGALPVRWVFQNPLGVPQRTALDQVVLPLLGLGLARGPAQAEALRLLDTFGLAGLADAPYGTLSGGEAQRLALARAIASQPGLLLVDEPTAQLDRVAAGTVNQLLAGLADRGMIVVVATHDPQTRSRCTDLITLAPEGASLTSGEVDRPGPSGPYPGQEQPETVVPVSADPASWQGPGKGQDGSRGQTEVGPGEPAPKRQSGSVRWMEALVEAWRNLSSGVSHGLAWALVTALIVGLLACLEARAAQDSVNDASDYVARGGATWVLEGVGLIDGGACDRLTDTGRVLASGALRQETGSIVIPPLPSSGVPLYTVTPGLSQVIGLDRSGASAGVWLSQTVAERYGLGPSEELGSSLGDTVVGAVYSYPDDGRQPGLGYAVLAPTVGTDGPFDQCWLTVWPSDGPILGLAQMALVPVSDPQVLTQVRLTQLNPTLQSVFTGAEDFRTRPTRLAGWISLVAGLIIGFSSGWARRLERASALHAGVGKGFLLLGAEVETLVWALAAVILAAPWILVFAYRAVADQAFIAVVGARPLLVGLVGVLAGSAVAIATTRESRLFAYFRGR